MNNKIEPIYDFFNLNYMGDFNQSIEIEKQCQPIADGFYRGIMPGVDIKRYDYNNPQEKTYQTHDIDCLLTPTALGIGTYNLFVSEKFRLSSWGDMLIELWSDFDGEKIGWSSYGDNKLDPDVYMYFTPNSIYEIWNHQEFKELINKLHASIDRDKIKDIIEDYQGYDYTTMIDFEGTKIKFIKKYSYMDGRRWFGIAVCISWEDLIERFGVDIIRWQKIDGKFKRTQICN